MKVKIEKILNGLENSVFVEESKLTDIITDAPIIITILESGFEKLKNLLSEYKFKSEMDEIRFFKEQKPVLFSKLIYYQKVYQFELKRPASSYSIQQTYLEKELEQINLYGVKNADFVQYYRSGNTLMDEYYFLRGKREIDLNLESFYFERDPNFSTTFDFKVAKLLANDMLATYLNNELVKLKQQESNLEDNSVVKFKNYWTDKKVALVELIYAIHAVGSVNGGNIDRKMLASIFEKVFNVDLSDLYNIFSDICARKGDRTEYLNRLIRALNQLLDESDMR